MQQPAAVVRAGDLVIRGSRDGALTLDPAHLGWRYAGLHVRRISAGDAWVGRLREVEGAFLVLSGKISVRASSGEWSKFGGRRDVFSGGTFALYLSRDTDFRLTALSDAEVALCLARAEKRCEARLVTPDDYVVEERGQGQCARSIRHVLPPEFAADRLLVVEVYTPSGNWSSYPPHKHDTDDGEREAALEEIYYHRQSDPRGFALQRLYTKDARLELAATVRDGDVMLIPHGYHGPVAQAPGYEGYYLNVLAGERRTMANSDDPDHHWIRASWTAPPTPRR